MDDDIDIEEHDLMDNPTVQSIFPDLSVIKKELWEYDHGPDGKASLSENISQKRFIFDCDSSTDSTTIENPTISQSVVPSKKNIYSSYKPKKPKCKDQKLLSNRRRNQIDLSYSHSITENPKVNNKLRTQIKQKSQNKNKINKFFDSDTVIKKPNMSKTILSSCKFVNPDTIMTSCSVGNKKAIHSSGMKCHTNLNENIPSSMNDDTNGGGSKNLYTNKIILGSKPSKLPEQEKKNYVNHFIPYEPKVTLQDVSSYLNESERYCADCLILFPKNSMYDVHKTMLHSPNICSDGHGKEYSIKSNINGNHKCELCQIYFTTIENLAKHKKKFHKDKAENTTNVVNNSVQQSQNMAPHSLTSNYSCFHCLKLFEDQKSLIEHLYNVLEPKKKDNIVTKQSLIKSVDEKQLSQNIVNFQENHVQRENKNVKRKSQNNSYNKKAGMSIQNLYSCPVCSQYFISIVFFMSHMAQKHKVKQMSKLKKVTFDPKCKYCSVKSSTFVSYNKHLQRRHRNQNELQRILKNQPKVMVSKIQTTAIKPPTSIIVPYGNDLSDFQNDSGWVPFAMKSVLFKCNKCDIHFLSAKDSVLHVEHMEMLVNWKCFTCSRIFKNRDVALHKKQHTFCDDFEVYDLGESALNRVLYNCPKCAIHFTEDRYICHYPTCEIETVDSAYCDSCDILVDKSSMRFHQYCHKYNKFKSSDFSIIETTIILGNDLSIKNQNSAPKTVEAENNMCVDKKSKGVPIKPKFDMKRENLCSANNSLSETISMKAKYEDKRKNGSSDNSMCIKKQNTAANTVEVENNMCVDEKSPSKAVLMKPKYDNAFIESTSSALTKEITEPNEILPIIYSCRACFIGMETYDKVIEHCQDHSARKQDISPLLKCNSCNIKFYRGSYEAHKKIHENKSVAESSLKILSFDPIYFSSENKIWAKHILGSLPIEQSAAILNNSIYKYEGRLKMHVTQDGPSNLTVYKCDRCRSFIDPMLVYKHTENSCFKQRKHPCSHCGLTFISTATRVQHEKIHIVPNIRLKSYRIVLFNRAGDMTFNNLMFTNQYRYVLYQCRNCNALVHKSTYDKHKCIMESIRKCLQCGLLLYKADIKCHETKHKDLMKFNKEGIKVILIGNKIDTRNNENFGRQFSFTGTIRDYTFYKCLKCYVCLDTEDQKLKHKCCSSSSYPQCPSCGLIIMKEKLKYHLKVHGNDPDFIRDNMNIVTFDESTTPMQTPGKEVNECRMKKMAQVSTIDVTKTMVLEGRGKDNVVDNNYTKKVAKIYKCHCGLHFLDEKCSNEHFSICNPKIRASKQNCSKCDLLFTPSDLFDHLLMHHGDKKILYMFEIINIFKECPKCVVHFSTASELNKHFECCYEKGNEKKNDKECKISNLKLNLSHLRENEHEGCREDFTVEDISEIQLDI